MCLKTMKRNNYQTKHTIYLNYFDNNKIIKNNMYEAMGYKVVRIPYFIQLTNEVIKIMFDRDIKEMMFNPNIPSMGVKGMNTPAYCCPAGIKRMAREFHLYSQQYEVNIRALEKENDFLSGSKMLKDEYNQI